MGENTKRQEIMVKKTLVKKMPRCPPTHPRKPQNARGGEPGDSSAHRGNGHRTEQKEQEVMPGKKKKAKKPSHGAGKRPKRKKAAAHHKKAPAKAKNR